MAKLLESFLEQTSIHGVAYLVDNRIRLAEKVFWLLALFCSCIGCVLLVWEVMGLIRDDPIITYTSDTPISIGEIPFVAVTLCPLTNTYNDEFNYDDLRTAILTKNISIWDLTEKELKYMQAVGLVAKDDFLTNFNISIDASDVIDFIKQLERFWNGYSSQLGKVYNSMDFSKKFQVALAKIITPWGFCYSFNVVDAAKLLHLNRIDSIFNYSRPIKLNFRIDLGEEIPNNASYPWKTNDRALGLWSEISVHSPFLYDEPIYHKNFVTEGSSYRIHSPYELPFYRTNELISKINSSTRFLITPQISYLDESLIDDGIERRQCYFVNEKVLQTFKVYTKNNCIQECVTNATLKTCGCVQFFMPRHPITKICGIHDQKCTRGVEARADLESSCKCLPLCEDTKYSIEQRQTEKSSIKFEIHQHGSVITVQFGKDEFYPTIRRRQFTEINFISYIGGTLGLFAGFSFLTVFELLTYFGVRACLGKIAMKKYMKKIQPIGRFALVESVKFTKVPKFVKTPLRFCHSYVENSSVHGVSHASVENLSTTERIIWLTLFAGSIGFCWILVAQTYEDYQDAPILLSIDNNIHQVQSIPFPAITISQERAIKSSFSNFFNGIGMSYCLEKFQRNGEPTTNFNESEAKKCHAQQMTCLGVDSLFRLYEFTFPELVEKIRDESDAARFANHFSSWNSVQRPVFVQIPTKYGFSFTFNLLGSEKLFKKSISSDFNFDGRKAVMTLPLHQAAIETDPTLYPLHTGGKSADGLEVVMHKGKRRDIDICREASFTLHSPFELPNGFDFSDFCDFDYQKVVTVSIIPEVINTDDALRSIDPVKRNCFFDGEKELKYFKTYTKNNCEMECLSEYTLQKCNCTAFYLIRNGSTPICHLRDINYISRYGLPKSLRHCGCLERCNSVSYRFEVRSDRLTTDYKPNSTDEVVLRFRFKESEYMTTRRHQPFTLVEFLAQAGGLLGLFVGASFLSVVEIFYFFTLRLLVNVWRSFKKMVGKKA